MKILRWAGLFIALGLVAGAEEKKKKSQWGRSPSVGQAIPTVSIKTKDGKRTIALHKPKRLTVIVFGSYTWGPFTKQAGRLQKVYEKYKNKTDFYWIYIREAHASDGLWPSRKVKISQHQTFLERQKVAKTCQSALNLKIPMLIDDMDNTANIAFQGFPDRLYILSPKNKGGSKGEDKVEGTIVYRGGRGPWGFKVDKMEKALVKLLKK